MIRLATIEDIPAILPLSVKFLAESPMSGKTVIDSNGLSDFLTGLVDMINAELWVVTSGLEVVGMSAVLMFPFYANPRYNIAQELFWFIDKDHRGEGGRLLEEMEKWAKASGAQSMHMISLETPSVKVMDRYYKRSGYTPIEHTYSKEL